MKTQKIQSKDTVEVIPAVPRTTVKSFLLKLLQNIQNWVEIYFWVPMSFFSIYILSKAAYYLSNGRTPRMNMDWFPELGVNLFKIVCALALTSVFKQALWGWMTVEEKIENPVLALSRMVPETVVFLAILYTLFNR